jgi:hypothetical protein
MSLKGDQGEEMQPLYLLQNTSVIYPSVVKYDRHLDEQGSFCKARILSNSETEKRGKRESFRVDEHVDPRSLDKATSRERK